MGGTPTPVNQAANTVDKILQTIIFDVAINAFKTYATAQFPVLGWPVFSAMFGGVLSLFGNYIYKALSQVATFTVIDIQTDKEKADYKAALDQFKAAHTQGDENGLKQSTADLKQALGRLIHFDGSSTV